jgi:hypothetical protein
LPDNLSFKVGDKVRDGQGIKGVVISSYTGYSEYRAKDQYYEVYLFKFKEKFTRNNLIRCTEDCLVCRYRFECHTFAVG